MVTHERQSNTFITGGSWISLPKSCFAPQGAIILYIYVSVNRYKLHLRGISIKHLQIMGAVSLKYKRKRVIFTKGRSQKCWYTLIEGELCTDNPESELFFLRMLTGSSVSSFGLVLPSRPLKNYSYVSPSSFQWVEMLTFLSAWTWPWNVRLSIAERKWPGSRQIRSLVRSRKKSMSYMFIF